MKASTIVIFVDEEYLSVGITDGRTVTVTPLTATLGSPATMESASMAEAEGATAPVSAAVESPELPRVFSYPGQDDESAAEDRDDAVPEFDRPTNSDDPNWINTILDYLKSSGIGNCSVILAIPSMWCLPARIDLNNLPRKNRRLAMAYRLEEQLPLAAEDFVADFIEDGEGHALGIAVPIDQLRPLVDTLERHDLAVDCICPITLLAIQSIQSGAENVTIVLGRVSGDDSGGISGGDSGGDFGGMDLLTIHASRLVSWRTATEKTISWMLQTTQPDITSQPNRLHAINLSSSCRKALANPGDETAEDLDHVNPGSTSELAVRTAHEMHRRSIPYPVNFRSGALSPQDRFRRIRVPLITASVALMLFLLCLGGVFMVRALNYQRQSDQYRSQLTSAYLESFPGQRVPTGMQRRLENHLHQLQRSRGTDSNSNETPQPLPDLLLLRGILAGLPDHLRVMILEIRIDGLEFTLQGQARSHSDTERIASSLRQTGCLTVNEPRSQALRNAHGVAFTLRGTYAATSTFVSLHAATKEATSVVLNSGGPES